MRNRRGSALRLSNGSLAVQKIVELLGKSGHVEKLVCDDTATDFVQRILRQPYETERFLQTSVHTTAQL